MDYGIIRLEESANVHGGAEVFVQVQFTDAATGCEVPGAMWLSDAQTNQYLADHDILPAIIATWADDSARRYYDENTVTPRQVRLALLADGLLDAVDAYVASQPRAVQLEWEYAGEIRGPPMTDNYADSLAAWRARRLAALTAEDGWLNLVGLWWMEDGPVTVGAAPGCDAVLPRGPALLLAVLMLSPCWVQRDRHLRDAGHGLASKVPTYPGGEASA